MIQGVPREVLKASQALACTTCTTVNIGIDRADISETHWIYFYDKDYFYTRLSFPHMLSPNAVPEGCGSIQAEVYYSDKYRPRDMAPDDAIDPVISDLRRCGLIKDSDTIMHTNARIISYANVIFDLEREEALPIVHGYLDEIGVAYVGRYGEWGYLWTDESFISGEAGARKAVEGL